MSAPSWPPAWADCWEGVGLPVPPRERVSVADLPEEPELGEWAESEPEPRLGQGDEP